MLTKLNRILGRQDGEHRQTKGRQKEDGFQSPCHTSRNGPGESAEHQRLEEDLQSLMKQKELLTRQKDLAAKLQHHFTVSQMRFENLQQEVEQTTAQDENLL
ncbi:uncharacterized protein LOC143269364 [Peromyscus maniculatus bairdii]|uniref:uncharacterized protein LOC143269364 n=1 Tax=Peromyscus maniculatus bairdii TaxID=230844 RepID=UPI003FD3F351